jgi:hypothetical protein
MDARNRGDGAMSIEPIGFLTILVGLLSLRFGYLTTFATLIVATLFGAAAAILAGGANIQPAHLFLGFALASVLARQHETAAALAALRSGQPGFWLLCLVVYGIATAIVIPRLLAGGAQIVPLGTSEYADTGSTVPLGPVSSNFTQSVYILADLVCFALTAAIASTQDGFRTVTTALLAYAAGNLLLAVLDIGTYATGTQALLDFIRNAQYVLHLDDEVYGMKRIVGSYPEASSFARATLGSLAFTGTLWLCGRRSALAGPLALASLILVVLSTSSTGLAGTPLVLLLLYMTLMLRGGFHPSRPYGSVAALCTPIAVAAVTLAVLLNDAAAETVRNYFDLLIFSKSSSASGVERSSWNTYAIQNFFDSVGFGVGLGTVRTSSFPIALVSNVGTLGTVFYLLFVGSALLRRRGIAGSFSSDVRMAARNSCLALIVGDTFAAPTVEQGLLFYILAGLACAEPEREMQEIQVMAHRRSGARA